MQLNNGIQLDLINDSIPASYGCGQGLQSHEALSYEVKGWLKLSTRKCIAILKKTEALQVL